MNIEQVFGLIVMAGLAICFTGAEILHSPGVALVGAALVFFSFCAMLFWALSD